MMMSPKSSHDSLPLPLEVRKVLTLALIEGEEDKDYPEGKVLLGLKKRGFGVGLWNGFGGKVEDGEDVKGATVREIEEESGLVVKPEDLEVVGLIHFIFKDDPVVLEVHVFRTNRFCGEVRESEEMKPKWWGKEGVPHHKMWPDDEVWYPLFLQRSMFRAIFLFEGLTNILSYKITSWNDPDEVIKEKGIDIETYDLDSLWDRTKELPVMVIKGQKSCG